MPIHPHVLAVASIALCLPAVADPASPRRIEGPVAARVIEVRDGDTVAVAAHIWPMQSVEVAVRLRGIDAPEMRGRCQSEIEAAHAARDRLAALIADGPVRLTAIEGDKYFGRVLADLAGGQTPDLGARLLREGLVDRYDGGRRRDWCAVTLGAAGAPRPGRT